MLGQVSGVTKRHAACQISLILQVTTAGQHSDRCWGGVHTKRLARSSGVRDHDGSAVSDQCCSRGWSNALPVFPKENDDFAIQSEKGYDCRDVWVFERYLWSVGEHSVCPPSPMAWLRETHVGVRTNPGRCVVRGDVTHFHSQVPRY
jgi:hypothetical protein